MSFQEKFARSPALVRYAPFVVFLLFTTAQKEFGPAADYWIYFSKTMVGAGLIIVMRPLIAEMRWAFSWEAVLAGVAVFAVWVGVSGEWTTQNTLWVNLGITNGQTFLGSDWNPNAQFGTGSMLACFFIAVRILGSALVVPPLEEVFYRSFLYRYLAKHEFLNVPLNRFFPFPFMTTTLIFGFVHNEWLAGIFCGAAYQGLVIRKGRLGDAMTAHAITNLLLGIWVVWRGAWNFW
jgi:uncharacterized protein